MGEDLNFDNILGEQDIETLFLDPDDESTTTEEPQSKEDADSSAKETKKENNPTEDIDVNELFETEQKNTNPESRGSEKKKEEQGKESTIPETQDQALLQHENFYSSIANACAVDGAFPNLDEETVKSVKTAEDYYHLLDLEVEARLDDTQKRIKQALDNGVEPSDIRKYENTLKYINSLTDKSIMEESDKGETLRRNLIYQDFINRGFNPDRAQKYTQRTIDAGTDVEDAKEALQNNKEFFQSQYNRLLEEAQENADRERVERQEQATKLKESIMKDKQLLGDIEIDNNLRQKAVDVISKPIYKDPNTGDYFTALQKYEMEHRAEFLKINGLIYALTNGFQDFDGFTKGKVKKEVKKGLRELEQTINNTRRNSSGALSMVTSASDDPNSYIGKGLKLDI